MASEAAEREGRTYWGMTARGCDSCKAAPALLFCRADSAFLCGACDAKVHGANKLASRHERVWMCEVCEQAPAAVTCKADAAALCVSCDADIHSANPLARRHDRVPVQPFFDFLPKAPVLHRRPPPQDDEDEDDDDGTPAGWPHQEAKMETHNLFSDVDPYLDLDYAASMDAGGFHPMDSVVPSRAPVAVPHVPAAPFYGFPDNGHYSKPSYVYAPSLSHSVSSSDAGVVPETGAMAEISNPYVTGVPVNPAAVIPPAVAVAGMDREARVKRYREKRKNRKFEKTIRYASRKAYAETRPRVKGRFAKRAEMDGGGYGIVPTF